MNDQPTDLEAMEVVMEADGIAHRARVPLEWRLPCPGCMGLGDDEDTAGWAFEDLRDATMTRHPTTGYSDDYGADNPLRLRGPWWELPTMCSACGTRWRLVIAPHKGSLNVALVNDGPVPTTPEGMYVE